MMNDRFKRAEEVKNKGGEFSRTWEDSSFWRTFLGKRLGNLRDYASQMISGGAEWLNMDNVAEFFDREDALYESKVLEKVRGMSNIRTGGYTSGKSAVVNIKGKDVNFILTEEGTIIDADNDIQYVPADSEEGRAEEKFIRDALKDSKDFDWNWDWTDGWVASSEVFGALGSDIALTLLTKRMANKAGITKRFKNILKTYTPFNPKRINTISDFANTSFYYGAAGAAEGWKNTYNAAVEGGLAHDEANSLAFNASWRQGAWWAATSIWVPKNMYNKIPWLIGNFKNITHSESADLSCTEEGSSLC